MAALYCSFCTIPMARAKAGVRLVKWLSMQTAAGGVKEIVLTGVNLAILEGSMETTIHRKFLRPVKALDTVQGN